MVLMMGNKYIVLLTCMYTDLQTHFYIHIRIHTDAHMHMQTQTQKHAYSHKNMHVHTHKHIETHAQREQIETHKQYHGHEAITNILLLERMQMYENKHWPPTQFSKHTHNCTVSAAALLSQ